MSVVTNDVVGKYLAVKLYEYVQNHLKEESLIEFKISAKRLMILKKLKSAIRSDSMRSIADEIRYGLKRSFRKEYPNVKVTWYKTDTIRFTENKEVMGYYGILIKIDKGIEQYASFEYDQIMNCKE